MELEHYRGPSDEDQEMDDYSHADAAAAADELREIVDEDNDMDDYPYAGKSSDKRKVSQETTRKKNVKKKNVGKKPRRSGAMTDKQTDTHNKLSGDKRVIQSTTSLYESSPKKRAAMRRFLSGEQELPYKKYAGLLSGSGQEDKYYADELPDELILHTLMQQSNPNLAFFKNASMLSRSWNMVARDNVFWKKFLQFFEEYILAILPEGKWYVENLRTLKTEKMELFKQIYLQYDYLIHTPSLLPLIPSHLKIRQVTSRERLSFHYQMDSPFELQAYGAHHFALDLLDALKPTKIMVPSPRIGKNGKHFYNCTDYSERLKFTDTIDIEPFLFVLVDPHIRGRSDLDILKSKLSDMEILKPENNDDLRTVSSTLVGNPEKPYNIRNFLKFLNSENSFYEEDDVPDKSSPIWTSTDANSLAFVDLKKIDESFKATANELYKYAETISKNARLAHYPLDKNIKQALKEYSNPDYSNYPDNLVKISKERNSKTRGLLFGIYRRDIIEYMMQAGSLDDFSREFKNRGPLKFRYLGPAEMYDRHRLIKSGMLELSFSFHGLSPFRIETQPMKVVLDDVPDTDHFISHRVKISNNLPSVPQKEHVGEHKYPFYLDIVNNYGNLGNARLSSMLEHRTLSILGAQSDVIRALDGKFQSLVTRQDKHQFKRYANDLIYRCKTNGFIHTSEYLYSDVFEIETLDNQNENMGTDYEYSTDGRITDAYYRALLFAWSRELIAISERAREIKGYQMDVESTSMMDAESTEMNLTSDLYTTSKKANKIALENIMSSLKYTNLPMSSYVKSYMVAPFSVGLHPDPEHPIIRRLFDRSALIPLHHPSSRSASRSAYEVMENHDIPFIAFIEYVVVDHWQEPSVEEKLEPYPRKYGRKIFRMLQQVERIHDQLTDNEYAFVLKIYISAERQFDETTHTFNPPLFEDASTAFSRYVYALLNSISHTYNEDITRDYTKVMLVQDTKGPENIIDARIKCYKRRNYPPNMRWDRNEGIKRSEQELASYMYEWNNPRTVVTPNNPSGTTWPNISRWGPRKGKEPVTKSGSGGDDDLKKELVSITPASDVKGLNYPLKIETTRKFLNYGIDHRYSIDGAARRRAIQLDWDEFKKNYKQLDNLQENDKVHISRLLVSSNINVMVPISNCSITALMTAAITKFNNNPYTQKTEAGFLAQDEKIRSMQFDMFLTEWMVDRNGVYLGREGLNAKKIGKWENTLDYSRLLLFSGFNGVTIDDESILHQANGRNDPLLDGLNLFSYNMKTLKPPGQFSYEKKYSNVYTSADYVTGFIYSFTVAHPLAHSNGYYSPQVVILPFDRNKKPPQPIAVIAGTTPIETRIKDMDTEPKYIKHGIHVYLRDANSQEEVLLCKFCKREQATLRCIHHKRPVGHHHHHPNHNQPIPFCCVRCSEQYCVLHC